MNTPITFANPGWLWLLAGLPLLAALFVSAERRRRAALDRLLAARLQVRLAGSVSTARRRWGFFLLLLGLGLALVAFARPRWGTEIEEVKVVGSDVILAVDTSRSMLAQDLAPNRLERAKLATLDLLEELRGDRVGLIAFAGEAFLQAPLTPDHEAVATTIRALNTEAIGQGGSSLAAAIQTAADAFGKGESTSRALVFFSDGEELQDDALLMADKYRDLFRIYTVGIGTEAGGPVLRPTRIGVQYVYDDTGNVVVSKLDETRLREVAQRAGGFYLRLQNGPADMRHLAAQGLGRLMKNSNQPVTREVPRERFEWPLVAGLVCLAAGILLGERRRTLGAAVAACFFLMPFPAQADGLRNAVGRILQQADPPDPAKPEAPGDTLRRIEAQRERHPGVPEVEYNAGCAAFAAGDFDKATAAFSKALGADAPALKTSAAYNLGNALARRGVKAEKEAKLSDWHNAVQQYDNVLALQPDHEPARKNREIVLKAIEDLNKKEQDQQNKDQQKKDKKDGEKDQQKEDQQDGENQDSERKNGDGKDGQPKEQNQPQQGGEQKDGEEKSAKESPGHEGQGDPMPQESAEADEAAKAAREGRMTERDAKALLDKMRELRPVLPLQQTEPWRRPRPGEKDW